MDIDLAEVEALVKQLKGWGLDAIECYSPNTHCSSRRFTSVPPQPITANSRPQFLHRRKGFAEHQLAARLLRSKTKYVFPRLLRFKVVGGHFFIHGFVAVILCPNVSEKLQCLSLEPLKVVRHHVQVLHLQIVLRELIAEIPRLIQAVFPVQKK